MNALTQLKSWHRTSFLQPDTAPGVGSYRAGEPVHQRHSYFIVICLTLCGKLQINTEETRQAELLLHVADATAPQFSINRAVYNVLTELGIEDTLLVLNKIDAIRDPATLNEF